MKFHYEPLWRLLRSRGIGQRKFWEDLEIPEWIKFQILAAQPLPPETLSLLCQRYRCRLFDIVGCTWEEEDLPPVGLVVLPFARRNEGKAAEAPEVPEAAEWDFENIRLRGFFVLESICIRRELPEGKAKMPKKP